MWSRFRTVLLPAFGAFAAIAAFRISAPFEASLNRPGVSLTDPEGQFTFGTVWGDVNRLAFGAILCGLFCFGLTIGRRAWFQVAAATLIGTALGGLTNFLTDSGSDLVGLNIARHGGMLGNVVASAAWCVLVPAGISLVTLISLGPTAARIRRAFVGTVWAGIASAAAQMAGSVFAAKQLGQVVAGAITGSTTITLQAFVPVWRYQEIAVGIALGLAMAMADQRIRVGTLRLVVGRNEARDWSLDYAVNRIGTAEGLEIPLGPIAGVEKVHATIVRQGNRFVLDSLGHPATVNGQPVATYDLNHFDTIELGSAKLRFLAGETLAPSYARSYGPPVSTAPVPLVPTAAPMAAVPMGILTDTAGGQYYLPLGEYGVGREPDNAICLSAEASVSRHHAKIVITPAATLLADMGSTNGTFVNGVAVVGDTPLQPGDTVRFGSAQLKVDRIPGPV